MRLEDKIYRLESKILNESIDTEINFVLNEMKRIGIDKLPYSYSALKSFIDPKTMEIHYNKHYKGYVNNLNNLLKDNNKSLEDIIQTISKYNEKIRNNAGGAFNHALFWKMLSPSRVSMPKELSSEIIKNFGSIQAFKKKFEEVANANFGSGWVWLVKSNNGKLKIVTTKNQDNPLMNVLDQKGVPILGLDLWEHAYYLKYQNNRDKYIKNFWENVNWDFVNTLLSRSNEKSKKNTKMLSESKLSQACSFKEQDDFKFLIKNQSTRRVYIKGINDILKKVYPTKWRDETDEILAGFYGIENDGRSVINNINTNYTAFCTLVKMVNKEISALNKPNKLFDFSLDKNKTPEEVDRFIRALDYFKDKLISLTNEDFSQLIKIMRVIWDKGQQSETTAEIKLKKLFGDKISVKKTGDHGSKIDAIQGIDLRIKLNGKELTAQVKLYDGVVETDSEIKFIDTGNVNPYLVDWMIFVNNKTNKTYVIDNEPIDITKYYIFNINSVLHIID